MFTPTDIMVFQIAVRGGGGGGVGNLPSGGDRKFYWEGDFFTR